MSPHPFNGRRLGRFVSVSLLGMSLAAACRQQASPDSQSAVRPVATAPSSEASSEHDEPDVGATAGVDSGASSTPGPRVESLLEVPGHQSASLFVPSGGQAQGALRVALIAHGAGGRGVDHCRFWDARLAPGWVLVCPSGVLLDRRQPRGGAFFPDHLKLREELRAVIAALRERLEGRIESDGWRFVGYSQGATMGALSIVGEIFVFDELVLIEGGGENWTLSRALDFRDGGGQRVLLSCGTSGCNRHAERSESALSRAGVQVLVSYVSGVGHTYGGLVGESTLERMTSWD